MSMEIESGHHVNESIDRNSPFGFRIPGFNDEQKIIEILKSKYPEHKRLEDMRLPSNLTIEDLTRELKREQILLNNKNIVRVENRYEIDAIDLKTLSETEQAFHLVYNPLHNILTDNEAQIWKTTQPSLKLVSAKESKVTSSNPLAAQYMLDGKLVSQAALSSQTSASIRGNNIIMQSHLTYQLSSNTKNLLFDIKDPIILSPNLVEKFCKCQKSYEGELMIKCSNDHCQIVWYHPGCVGLGNTNPKALEEIQFTCEDCRETEKNAKKLNANSAAAEKPSRKKVAKN